MCAWPSWSKVGILIYLEPYLIWDVPVSHEWRASLLRRMAATRMRKSGTLFAVIRQYASYASPIYTYTCTYIYIYIYICIYIDTYIYIHMFFHLHILCVSWPSAVFF